MTSDENWPEEPEGREPGVFDEVFIQKMKWLQGQVKAAPWTERNKSRERVYEAAKVTTRIKRHYTQSPLGQSGWSGTGYSKCRYEVQGLVNGRWEGFFGDTLAEALERMGEAMELELTKESK